MRAGRGVPEEGLGEVDMETVVVEAANATVDVAKKVVLRPARVPSEVVVLAPTTVAVEVKPARPT